MKVHAWLEKIDIPTYETGRPEKNPLFLEKRIYQGSSGVVYPNAVIEKIEDEKHLKSYDAIFIENDYLKIMILPELGGRVHRAYDKLRGRDFIYYNQVIKPALVGLTGPWISGGIEFNWPQHHRPSTFEPVDYKIETYEDGSATVWVSEVEKMSRTKGMAGFTLYPDKAYLEIKGRLYNRTPFAQSFLWWANPAVKVNDFYQSVFPPDVHAVFDHGKRDVSAFPIARGTYYKVDYAPGTDISMYKNIPVPTSFMAAKSKYDFIGSYEHDRSAGMLHIANHHVSNGKKQWTWGNGDFGRAWDRNLTDEDGPYIEIMCGVFTDNQPDFSWIQPGEEKGFEQYFMPYAEIGMVKNATKEAALSVTFDQLAIQLKVYVTQVYPGARIQVFNQENSSRVLLHEWKQQLTPIESFQRSLKLSKKFAHKDITLRVCDQRGNILVEWQQDEDITPDIPIAAKAALAPADIATIEELYLNGLHLEQYRHATFSALDYYNEGLRRDPLDVRCNNAVGRWYLRIGKSKEARPYFNKAIERLTSRNPNPDMGEPYYNLGLSLVALGEYEQAMDALYKATWNDAWQHAGFLELARTAALKGDFDQALSLIEKSLLKSWHSHSARHLKVILLRKLGKIKEADDFIEASLKVDPFNFGCLFEALIKKGPIKANENLDEPQVLPVFSREGEAFDAFATLIRNSFNNYLEYCIDYFKAGFYGEAIAMLELYIEQTGKEKQERIAALPPLLYYYLGWLYQKYGGIEKSDYYFKLGMQAAPDYCFAYKVEDRMVLEAAASHNRSDSQPHYLLGNYWYAHRQYTEAIRHWEASVQLNDDFATVHRNLSLAYYNKKRNAKDSLAEMKKAFELDTTDARVLMELDQLYKIENFPVLDRLALLEKHIELVEFRDDLYLERITLYNQLGNYAKARDLIRARKFHPWEGGEGKVVTQYLICHLELAKAYILKGEGKEALTTLNELENYPFNLGEGKLYGAQENDLHYLQGCALELMAKKEESQTAAHDLRSQSKAKFELATKGISEPVQAIFYNDPQPDKIFYQGLAWIKLGAPKKAATIFEKLVDFGRRHLDDKIKIDYFAVSLPDLLVFDQDLDIKNRLHCLYLIGLGKLGLGDYSAATKYLEQVLEGNLNHQGAQIHLQMVAFLKAEAAI